MLRRAFTGLCIGGAPVAACAGGGTGSSGTVGPCKTYSACTVVTSADVTSATGTNFLPGKESDSNATPSATRAETVMCNFDSGRTTDPFVTVLVRCCPCGDNDPSAATQSFGGTGMTVTNVSGVGDSAIWVETSSDAGGPVIDQLVVFVGANFQVIVSIATPLGQMFTFDPLAASIRIATGATRRL